VVIVVQSEMLKSFFLKSWDSWLCCDFVNGISSEHRCGE